MQPPDSPPDDQTAVAVAVVVVCVAYRTMDVAKITEASKDVLQVCPREICLRAEDEMLRGVGNVGGGKS